MTETPPPCPKCGSARVIPISFGMPGPELQAALERGDADETFGAHWSGGCMPPEHRWHCRDCEHQFGEREDRY